MGADSDAAKESTLRCSFCRKTQDEVRALIAGPSSTNICDDCVIIAMEIVSQQALNTRAGWRAFEFVATILTPIARLAGLLRFRKK